MRWLVGAKDNLLVGLLECVKGMKKFYLPGQSLVYQYNGKELVTTLDSLKIEIFEPTLSDTTKIQPIKPIWEEKRNSWDFLPYILIFLGICAVLYFIYKWWKKRQKKIIDDRWFEEDPNDWFLAKIEEIENYKQAKKYIEKSLEINVNNAVVLEHLGDIYHSMKDDSNAKKYWNLSLNINPGNSILKEKIEKLKSI